MFHYCKLSVDDVEIESQRRVTLLYVDTADKDQCEYTSAYEKPLTVSGAIEVLEIYDLD